MGLRRGKSELRTEICDVIARPINYHIVIVVTAAVLARRGLNNSIFNKGD
jgi:hypothetical protein